jgi:tRNA nucleotidyltransferase (CCA-adding enzyme)
MVNKEGLEYYEVGGAPRDKIMGREPNDYDYVVVGESPEDMVDRGFLPIMGADFPVFLDKDSVPDGEEGEEYALARTERKSQNPDSDNPYHNFEVKVGEDISLKEDLKRRDFTINSIAMDPSTGEIIDPYGGRKDIERGKIRHVSEAFKEDPLRVIRMARFASRFDFDVDPETMDLAREVVHKIEYVPNDRIMKEMYKAMKQAQNPAKFFRVCLEANVFDHFMTEVKEMVNISAGPDKYHKEENLFEHSLMVTNELHKIRGNNYNELIGAFLHDIGKVRCEDNHYKHPKKGADLIEDMFERIGNVERDLVRTVRSACKDHMKIKRVPEMGNGSMIDLVKDYENSPISIDFLIDLGNADSRGRIPSSDIDTDLISEKVLMAKLGTERVDGEYLYNRHSNFDEFDPEKKGQVVRSDYCREYSKVRKIMTTEWFKGV